MAYKVNLNEWDNEAGEALSGMGFNVPYRNRDKQAMSKNGKPKNKKFNKKGCD